jgi:hypothetical protein
MVHFDSPYETKVRLEFRMGARLPLATDARSFLCSGRTNFATMRSAFSAFARRGHLNLPPAEDQPFTVEKIARKPEQALQAWLGHKNIQHTVRYTELAPDRFKNFWRD